MALGKTDGAKESSQPAPFTPMGRDMKTGLILNGSGLGLFLVWVLFQNALPLGFSLALAVVFCGLLGSSLVYLFRAARSTPQDSQSHTQPPKPTYRKE